MDVEKLEAGPELDALVAEKVMGWKWMSWIDKPTRHTACYPAECRVREFLSPRGLETRSGDSRWRDYLRGRQYQEATGEEPLAYTYCSNVPRHEFLPAFSTDMAAAWEVVEKLAEQGHVSCVGKSDHGDYWYCELRSRYAEAPRATLAICRAALAATIAAVIEPMPNREPVAGEHTSPEGQWQWNTELRMWKPAKAEPAQNGIQTDLTDES